MSSVDAELKKKEKMQTIIKTDPAIKYESYEDLFRMPVTIVVTEFDDNAFHDFIEDMGEAQTTGQPVVPIIINSHGGCAYNCLGMLSAIENSRIPVATIVMTKAQSAGSVLFAWGTDGYRYMDPNATLMLHDISDFVDDKLEDLKNEVRHLEFLNKNLYKRMSRRLGHEDNYFNDLIDKARNVDLFLTSKEAKRHKIANFLRVPTLEVSVDVNYKFG